MTNNLLDYLPKDVAEVAPSHLNNAQAIYEWLNDKVSLELKPVKKYLFYLHHLHGIFIEIEKYFPQINPGRDGRHDTQNVASSPYEHLAISNQLYIAKSHDLKGVFLECGCFKGFSTSCLSHACEYLNIPMVIADSFEGLPDIQGETDPDHSYHQGDFSGGLDEVKENIGIYGGRPEIKFLKGWFCDTLKNWDQDILSLWMDVDLIASAQDVLSQCASSVVKGGSIFSHEIEAGSVVNEKIVPNAQMSPETRRFHLAMNELLERYYPKFIPSHMFSYTGKFSKPDSFGKKAHELIPFFMQDWRPKPLSFQQRLKRKFCGAKGLA